MLRRTLLSLITLVVLSTAAEASGRPAGAPKAWCGFWLGQHLGLRDRSLWLARNWASVGHRTSPGVGVIVVWRHHVGIITGRSGAGWVVKSGNDGRRVRERPRSIAGAIAFRGLHGQALSMRASGKSDTQVAVWQARD